MHRPLGWLSIQHQSLCTLGYIHLLVAFRRACITSCNVCDSPNCIRGALNSSRANYFDGLQIRIVGIGAPLR